MKSKYLAAAVFACAALLVAPTFAAEEKKKEQPKDIVLKGDARCTECHDENDSPKALTIGKTKHGVGADKRTPTCTSCHGESDEHVKKAGRGSEKAPPVDILYNKKTKNTAEQQNKACLSCHQGGKRIHWQSGAHAAKDVACTSCHSIHNGHDKVRDKSTQTEVCYSCHKEQRGQMARPNHHPVPEGKMGCTSCHDVHGGNPKLLVRQSTNDTCYSCHMEKRGPFVHNHQPVSEDCGICHQPHGTTTPNLLKARMPFLCQQCHGDGSHRLNVAVLPSIPTTNSGSSDAQNNMGTVGRSCTNCHTNIHGSNSTMNNATAGRFRR